jgi:hypothetical protein
MAFQAARPHPSCLVWLDGGSFAPISAAHAIHYTGKKRTGRFQTKASAVSA